MPETATHVGSGKVRELYALDDDRLLLVASDRISTFDVVLPTEIPDKGRVLTGLSAFWFARTHEHLREPPARRAAGRPVARSAGAWRCSRSSASCAATSPAPAGRTTRRPATVCGHALPAGLARLRSPARADLHAGDEGADRPRREHHAASRPPSSSALIGSRRSRRPRSRCTASPPSTRPSAGSSSPTRSSSSGSTSDGRLVLADEAFTPDSSRFWPADAYEPGRPQPSFDKQFVRDYCETLGWDKTDPGPELPEDVVAGTRARYVEAFERLTERPFDRYVEDPEAVLAVRATVLVRPKPGILDPQGQAVESSLRQLGFAVGDARVGRVVDLEVEASDPVHGAGGGRADVRAAAHQPVDRELRDRAAGVSEARPRIAVITFPGSNDDRDATARARAARRRRRPGLARRRTAARRGGRRATRGLLVRRLPALRRDRPLLAGDESGRRVRRRRAAWCSGSATASRSSARPASFRGR